MIRIDEIYNNIFYKVISRNPKNSMHYFDPFGRTDYDAMCVAPLINDRDNAFIFWDQEPFLPSTHNNTIDTFHLKFIYPPMKAPPKKKYEGEIVEHPVANAIFITSEKDSKNVNELCDRLGYKSVYYFFHAWASLDWFRGYNRTFLSLPYNDRTITNTFICPNRIVSGERKHRITLMKELVINDLVKDNKISFPLICPYSNETIEIDGVSLPLVFDNEDANNIPNESYKISLWEHSKNSLLQVVTETIFKEETLHLTEKIFKPIVMQMPFVLVGARYNLEYLKSYGFKTFSDFWNEDYDNQPNETRIESVVNLLKDLNDMTFNEKKQLQRHLSPIVEHNFKWFYSNKFEKLLWTELTHMTSQWD
jgi:hypothetical protein